jgi:predicted acyl esterase
MAFEEYRGTMFGPKWKSSPRKYSYVTERDVRIPMRDGVRLNCSIWRPDSNEKFPAILGFHCYHAEGQTGRSSPRRFRRPSGAIPVRNGLMLRSRAVIHCSSRSGVMRV